MMAKGLLSTEPVDRDRNQQITANHVAKDLLRAGSSTGTRKSSWQRVSLAPESSPEPLPESLPEPKKS